MKNFFWVFTNWYGKLFGHAWLAPLHHAVATSSLHALGYGNIHKDSWTGEEWFLRSVIAKSEPNVVFDVGANIGNYSKLLLKHTDATVYAFEPNPFSFEQLQLLPESVVKVNKAVSDTSGEAELYFRSGADERASLDSRIREGQMVNVSVTTLTEYCQENNIEEIDFLKVDTEGFEREVLTGLGDIKPKYIQMEFNHDHLIRSCSFLDLSRLLPEYVFYRLLPNGWVKVKPDSYIDNVYIFSNFIAVRK